MPAVKESPLTSLDRIMCKLGNKHNVARRPQKCWSVLGPIGMLSRDLMDVRHLPYALVSLGSTPIGPNTYPKRCGHRATLCAFPRLHIIRSSEVSGDSLKRSEARRFEQGAIQTREILQRGLSERLGSRPSARAGCDWPRASLPSAAPASRHQCFGNYFF